MAPGNDEPAPLGASQGVSIKAHVWMVLMDRRFGLHEANHDFGLWNFMQILPCFRHALELVPPRSRSNER